MRRRLLLGVLALWGALARPASALPPLGPTGAGAPAGLAELEGRGVGAPGSAAAILGDRGALRFATAAGGAASLVLYLAPAPRAPGEPRESVALASLLGVPGEVRLEAPGRAAPPVGAPADASAREPVPEPSALALGLGGLLMLGRLARRRGPSYPAARWSGPPARWSGPPRD
jgi:hypothetical protein